QKKPRGKLIWKILCALFTLLFIVTMVGEPILMNYKRIIDMYLGHERYVTVVEEGESEEEVEPLFKHDFYGESKKEAAAHQQEAADAICESIVSGGAVLLLNNDHALPLQEGSKITLLGNGSAHFVYGGTGSGGMDASKATNLKDALEADTFSVNPTMWTFYQDGPGKEYGWKEAGGSLNNFIFDNAGFAVNEVPLKSFTDAEWDSVSSYSDAAIMVVSRVCGEGKDLPVAGAADAGGNVLSISQEEKDILGKLAQLKAEGSLQKIILLLNTSNAVELDVLNPELCGTDYGIDACLWVGGVGQSGINAIGDLLHGAINFSGRLVDTYCYDNTTSPAIQNAYVTAYTNAAEKNLSFKGSNDEYYAVYQEGIYVGYRYYETRYEDVVLGTEKTGDYDYASTVAFPFGYGLSYSDLSYENLAMQEAGEALTFTVDVKNDSDIDARDAVLLYMQSPYTDYDKENGIEKSAIELVGYSKISVPAKGSATATITVPKTELRCYDANGAKTYILDAGNYYFAVGNGSHDALNNVLSAKAEAGVSVDKTKMTSEGDASLALSYVVDKQDNTLFATADTGMAITNQLDHADLNKVDDDTANDIAYVSRSDWEGTMPQAELGDSYKASVQMAASEEIVSQLKTIIDSTGEGTMPTTGKEGSLTLAHFIGIPYDGSISLGGETYTWDDLLDQVTIKEMREVVGNAYHCTAPIKSVGKPSTKDENGPQGITAQLTGGASSTAYTSEDMLSSCFDEEIVYQMGASIGNDCLMANRKAYSGIYGPGANIHRTPYSGRNFEYYSEDPFVSGKTCVAETNGIQSKGVYVYLKHFAMNDQESGRDGIGIWTNEQAARELYLQAFEYPITEAGAYCVMTSFNRMGALWAGGDYNLLTNILRGEWNMAGFAITDFSNNNNYMDVVQGVLAGGDAWDCNDDGKWVAKLEKYEDDPQVVSALREATKHILYTVANSNAMNGASANTHEIEVRAPWEDWVRYAQIGTAVLAVLFLLLSLRKAKK
ncbi:MAG: glycoside hydrolase family 3 C-terminal domain-containing protein, partial [Blautia sp.]|nr:glycoside hydrolase family 3 C-terminal domain-containing protein [Blautia sp.]